MDGLIKQTMNDK